MAFIIFNRLDTTKKVFAKIREARPPKLYLISDAARKERKGENEKVNQVRKYVEENIDWNCQIYKNYANSNMGCRDRIVSGLNWCFESEEKLIILEDDCLPSTSFFRYCEELLEYYKEDERVMHIGGYNNMENYKVDGDYFFSSRPCGWGWATWRRAWKKYDKDMVTWPKIKKDKVLRYRFYSKEAYNIREEEWDSVYDKSLNAWGYQWDYAIMVNSAFAIVPAVNLIQNIGFGEDATHTVEKGEKILGKLQEMHFPMKYRNEVIQAFDYDFECMKIDFITLAKRKIKKVLRRLSMAK